MIPAIPDTLHHLYQNSIYATGLYGEYNTLGNNFTSRDNRIFIDRPEMTQFYFTQPYSFTTKEPDQFLFVNTLSPYAHISYESCGNKQHGEDHIDAKFATNVNKKLGFGFDLDYHYGTGYYANQNNSHFRAALFGSYHGDQYQAHMLTTFYHRKVTENGGIKNDEYITHPEAQATEFSEEEIPTVLSSNWNRNNSQHIYYTHRYNIGFYRKVKMTDEEIKARQFAIKSAKEKEERENRNNKQESRTQGRRNGEKIADKPMGRPDGAQIMGDEPVDGKPQLADSTRIKVESQEKLDSLKRAQEIQDSIDATMKREFVPVTSIIHTIELNNHSRIYQAYNTPSTLFPESYYDWNDEGVYGSDSIYDEVPLRQEHLWSGPAGRIQQVHESRPEGLCVLRGSQIPDAGVQCRHYGLRDGQILRALPQCGWPAFAYHGQDIPLQPAGRVGRDGRRLWLHVARL